MCGIISVPPGLCFVHEPQAAEPVPPWKWKLITEQQFSACNSEKHLPTAKRRKKPTTFLQTAHSISTSIRSNELFKLTNAQIAYGVTTAFPSCARGITACSPAAESETNQLHTKGESKQFSSITLEDIMWCFTCYRNFTENLWHGPAI